jgi:hypothetical protein
MRRGTMGSRRGAAWAGRTGKVGCERELECGPTAEEGESVCEREVEGKPGDEEGEAGWDCDEDSGSSAEVEDRVRERD